MLGHSVGEFTAACVAGVFSLEDGIRLIANGLGSCNLCRPADAWRLFSPRNRRWPPRLSPTPVRSPSPPSMGPKTITISGDVPAVEELLARLAAAGIKSKPLATSHAFHSHRMDPMLDALREAAVQVTYSKPSIDIACNLTGCLADEHTFADPCYWRNTPARRYGLPKSMQVLAERGCEVFLEIGPSPTLIGMGQRCLPEGDYGWLPSLRSGRNEWQSLLESLGQLHVRGAKVDWVGFDRPYSRRKVALPTYPFQRTRYWAGSLPDSTSAVAGSAEWPRPASFAGPQRDRRRTRPHLRAQMSVHRPATLADHKIQGRVIVPGAAYLEMALAAGEVLHGKPWCVRDMSLVEPLILDKTPKTLQTIVTPEGPQAAAIRIVRVVNGEGGSEPEFVTHAVGHIEARDARPHVVDLESVRGRFTGEARDSAWCREALRKSGLEPGPTFCWLDLHWGNPQEALGQVRLPCEADRADRYWAHPGLLDTALQLLGSILPGAGTGIDAYVPMAFKRLQCFAAIPQGPLWVLATLTSFDGKRAVGNFDLIDEQGQVVLRMEGATLQRVSRDWISRLVAGPVPDWCYELAWTAEAMGATAVDETAVEPGRWLIYDSRDGAGTGLAERFRMKAHECTVVSAETTVESRRTAIEEFLAAPGPAMRGVIYLSGLDVAGEAESPDFAAARRDGWGDGLGSRPRPHAFWQGEAAAIVVGHPRWPRGRRGFTVCAGTVAGMGTGSCHRGGASGTGMHADRPRSGQRPR